MENLKIIFACTIGLLALYILFKISSKKDENPSGLDILSDDIESEEPASVFCGNVSAKRILTDSEAYNLDRILESLPEDILICPQVSFNSFIKCNQMKLRNSFNRKSVDYLIVDLDYNPLLVVECDDDSHSSKKVRMRDLQRDQIAAAAGIPTLRITNKTPTEDLGRLIREHIKKAA